MDDGGTKHRALNDYGRFAENLVSPMDIVAARLRLIYREISLVLPRGIQQDDVRMRARRVLII